MTSSDKPLESTSAEKVGEVVAITLNAIPAVGGVLAEIANAVISKRQNRRLNEFLTSLAEDLKNHQDRVNREFVKTEEFEDLAENIMSKAAETRQKEKLDALRYVFVNTVLSDRPNYDEASEITEMIDKWQPRHIILIQILADPLGADQKMGNTVGKGGGLITSISAILRKLLPNWDDDQIERTWNDLYGAQIHRTSGTKTMMTDKGIHQLDNRLTDFGNKVAEYLKSPKQ